MSNPPTVITIIGQVVTFSVSRPQNLQDPHDIYLVTATSTANTGNAVITFSNFLIAYDGSIIYRIKVVTSAGQTTYYDYNPLTQGMFGYTLSSLQYGIQYSVSVVAVVNSVQQIYSPILQFQIPGPPTPPYGITTTLNAPEADCGKRSVTLYWKAPVNTNVSTISGYNIQATIGGVVQTPVFYTGSTETKATIYYLFYGLTYTFTVTAVSNFGNSPASSPCTPITVTPYLPNAPNQITAISGQPGKAILSWQDNPVNGGAILNHQILINNLTTKTTTTKIVPYTG